MLGCAVPNMPAVPLRCSLVLRSGAADHRKLFCDLKKFMRDHFESNVYVSALQVQPRIECYKLILPLATSSVVGSTVKLLSSWAQLHTKPAAAEGGRTRWRQYAALASGGLSIPLYKTALLLPQS